MGVASLVLGILSILFSLVFAGMNWLGAVLGIIGIVLASTGRKNPEQRGLATAGLVCSIVGFIFGILAFIGCAICVGTLSSMQ